MGLIAAFELPRVICLIELYGDGFNVGLSSVYSVHCVYKIKPNNRTTQQLLILHKRPSKICKVSSPSVAAIADVHPSSSRRWRCLAPLRGPGFSASSSACSSAGLRRAAPAQGTKCLRTMFSGSYTVWWSSWASHVPGWSIRPIRPPISSVLWAYRVS